MEWESKQLKPYKGFIITKNWLLDSHGRILKNTITYDAVDENSDGLLDAKKNLNELKKVIDKYLG